MNSHKNAPLTPKGREAMVRDVMEGGLSKGYRALMLLVPSQSAPSSRISPLATLFPQPIG
jgi:hypothetical protein